MPGTLPTPAAPIALILHCYHPHALESVLRQWPAELNVDLLLTTDTALKATQLERCIRNKPAAHIRLAHVAILPNHGRDVLPFWRCLQQYHHHTRPAISSNCISNRAPI